MHRCPCIFPHRWLSAFAPFIRSFSISAYLASSLMHVRKVALVEADSKHRSAHRATHFRVCSASNMFAFCSPSAICIYLFPLSLSFGTTEFRERQNAAYRHARRLLCAAHTLAQRREAHELDGGDEFTPASGNVCANTHARAPARTSIGDLMSRQRLTISAAALTIAENEQTNVRRAVYDGRHCNHRCHRAASSRLLAHLRCTFPLSLFAAAFRLSHCHSRLRSDANTRSIRIGILYSLIFRIVKRFLSPHSVRANVE